MSCTTLDKFGGCNLKKLCGKISGVIQRVQEISFAKPGFCSCRMILMNTPKTDDRVRGSLNGVGFQKQASFSFPCKFSPKTAKLIVTEKVKLISCLFTTTTVCNSIAPTIGS